MKLIGKTGLSGVLEKATVALMAIALLLMLSLPWTIPFITKEEFNSPDGFYMKYLIVLLLSGVIAELILWQARGIMHNVNNGKSFCRDTVRRLRVMGWECLAVGLVYGAAVFFVTKIFMAVVLVTFAVVGSTLLVISELFRQAVEYKEENDMTI